MKKLFIFLLLLIAFTFTFQYKKISETVHSLLYQSPCDTPITYHVGQVDPKFNTTPKEFEQNIQQAASIWNKSYGKQIFIDSQKGDISINLIYDERQLLQGQIRNLGTEVQKEENSLNPKIEDYKARLKIFKSKVDDLNRQIDYWNSHGGAPPADYQKLTQQQKELQQEKNELDIEARALNQSTNDYNSKIRDLNNTVDTFNETLKDKPEEGIYIYDNGVETINIYFNLEKNELIHTIAHELGHAIGIMHNKNNLSIMYPQTTSHITLTKDDVADLQKVCAKRDIVTFIRDRLPFYIQKIRRYIITMKM